MKNSLDRALKLLFDVRENREITVRPYVYEIGGATNSFHLSFDEEPHGKLYYNAFFIKILSFDSTNQALECLNFHFSQFPNKTEFLDFVENETFDVIEILQGGVPLPSDKRKIRILTACRKWIKNKKEETSIYDHQDIRSQIETELIDLIMEIKNARIEVNPQIDAKKIILLLLALQKQVIDEKGVGVLKFKHTVELPHLLKYFVPFANNKVDGLRKQTTLLATSANLTQNVPTYLLDALQNFFFRESIKILDSD